MSGCPVWEKFVGNLLGDSTEDAEYFQMFCGYLLADHCQYERFLALCGNESATEAVFRVMEMIVGVRQPIVISERFFGSPGCQRLSGARLCRYRGGLPKHHGSEGMIGLKKLVAGERMTAEGENDEFVSFHPRAKVVCLFPEPPSDVIASLAKKMIVVNFPASLPENFEIPLYRRFVEEKDGIRRWMVEGLGILTERGGFWRFSHAGSLISALRAALA